MKYAVTVLFDASRSVTVEAKTPEKAEEIAHQRVGSATLCHQCSDDIDMGDATGALVYADDGEGPQVLDTTYSGETIARLKAELAAAEARNATLTDDAARYRFLRDMTAAPSWYASHANMGISCEVFDMRLDAEIARAAASISTNPAGDAHADPR